MPASLTSEGIVEISTYGNSVRVSGLQLRLVTAGPDPGFNVTWGDYTEAVFPGYAPLVLSGAAPVWDPFTELAVADYGPVQWVLSSDIPPITITGVVLYNQFVGNTILWAFANAGFPATVLQHMGDTVDLHPVYFGTPL